MRTLKHETLRRQPLWGRQSEGTYGFMGYIAAGDKEDSVEDVKRKCLQQPGFLARSRRLLLSSRSQNLRDRMLTREY